MSLRNRHAPSGSSSQCVTERTPLLPRQLDEDYISAAKQQSPLLLKQNSPATRISSNNSSAPVGGQISTSVPMNPSLVDRVIDMIDKIYTQYVIAPTGPDAAALSMLSPLSSLASLAFDLQETEHTRVLEELWKQHHAEPPSSLLSDQRWQDLGFQGPNPTTDLRGAGLLGARNMLFLATKYPALFEAWMRRDTDEDEPGITPLSKKSRVPRVSFATSSLNVTGLLIALISPPGVAKNVAGVTSLLSGCPNVKAASDRLVKWVVGETEAEERPTSPLATIGSGELTASIHRSAVLQESAFSEVYCAAMAMLLEIISTPSRSSSVLTFREDLKFLGNRLPLAIKRASSFADFVSTYLSRYLSK